MTLYEEMNRGSWRTMFWTLMCSVALLGMAVSGCFTDAQRGKWDALGDPAYIECYSGDRLIYTGRSTGKVLSESNSDGYFFVDAADGKTKEVSGNCIITYSGKPASETLTPKK